jgi:hypothetical protein
MPEIPPDLLDGLKIGAVLAIFGWMLATSRLYTRSQHNELMAALRRENESISADRDVWRDNFLDQKGLMSQLLIGQETTNRLLRAIPKVEDDA